jgi:hypothetical protein
MTCIRKRVREKRGGVDGNMLRRGESSWLCMKFEFGFFASQYLIRVLPPSFLALIVNEVCLLYWPNPYATSCFLLHIILMRFPNGIFMLFFGLLVVGCE